MASLYERFAGKIDTNKSFPEHSPPEASLLLGQGVEEEATTPDPGPGPDLLRHRFQPHCEDEDCIVSHLAEVAELVRSADRCLEHCVDDRCFYWCSFLRVVQAEAVLETLEVLSVPGQIL
ncbi:unnamed protein product [Gadus morhua 'NCC']